MAGCEAAWQAAQLNVPVTIHEMRPKVETFAHQTGDLGEMVCSNSFRSDDDEHNAVGLVHWEMRASNSLIMTTADKHRIPAGGALGCRPRTLCQKHYISHQEHIQLIDVS